MVGVDQTPPHLAQPTVSAVQQLDNGGACDTNKCGWDHSATLANLATDDMSPADKIGYRVTVVAGTAPLVASWGGAIDGAPDGTLTLRWNENDGGNGGDFYFTLQLVAIDAAGNESAPQTVKVYGADGCRVGGQHARGGFTPLVVVLAVLSAAARCPRQRPR